MFYILVLIATINTSLISTGNYYTSGLTPNPIYTINQSALMNNISPFVNFNYFGDPLINSYVLSNRKGNYEDLDEFNKSRDLREFENIAEDKEQLKCFNEKIETISKGLNDILNHASKSIENYLNGTNTNTGIFKRLKYQLSNIAQWGFNFKTEFDKLLNASPDISLYKAHFFTEYSTLLLKYFANQMDVYDQKYPMSDELFARIALFNELAAFFESGTENNWRFDTKKVFISLNDLLKKNFAVLVEIIKAMFQRRKNKNIFNRLQFISEDEKRYAMLISDAKQNISALRNEISAISEAGNERDITESGSDNEISELSSDSEINESGNEILENNQ